MSKTKNQNLLPMTERIALPTERQRAGEQLFFLFDPSDDETHRAWSLAAGELCARFVEVRVQRGFCDSIAAFSLGPEEHYLPFTSLPEGRDKIVKAFRSQSGLRFQDPDVPVREWGDILMAINGRIGYTIMPFNPSLYSENRISRTRSQSVLPDPGGPAASVAFHVTIGPSGQRRLIDLSSLDELIRFFCDEHNRIALMSKGTWLGL
jgi:hypothetical protein